MTAPQNPRVTQADADVAQAIVSGVRGYGVTFASPLEHSASVMVARHREAAEAASKARLTAALEMAEDYHAAHIEQRQRADKAEAREAALMEALRKVAPLLDYLPHPHCVEAIDAVRAALTKEPDA